MIGEGVGTGKKQISEGDTSRNGHRTNDVATVGSAGVIGDSSNFISMDSEAGAGDAARDAVGAATNTAMSSSGRSNIDDATTNAREGNTIGAALLAGNSDAACEPTTAMADTCTSLYRSLWSVGTTIAAILPTFVHNSLIFASIVSDFFFFLLAMAMWESWVGWDLQRCGIPRSMSNNGDDELALNTKML
jgi:hypothetical protein